MKIIILLLTLLFNLSSIAADIPDIPKKLYYFETTIGLKHPEGLLVDGRLIWQHAKDLNISQFYSLGHFNTTIICEQKSTRQIFLLTNYTQKAVTDDIICGICETDGIWTSPTGIMIRKIKYVKPIPKSFFKP